MKTKQIKSFLDYDAQIKKLHEEKGLFIHDENFAKEALTNISYYALISGYKDIFYDKTTRKYIQGTTFNDILSLYYFDKELRGLVFQYICVIEQKMRSLISYYFSEQYCANECAYLSTKNYQNTSKNQKKIDKLIAILKNEAKINENHHYIIYQRKTYDNVPLWVLMNTLTFGQVSTMYSLLQSNLKTKISKNHFIDVNERELTQYLKVLTQFRNVCAHNERLFLFSCRNEIPDTVLHKKMKIAKKGNQYQKGKSDMFAIMIAFRYLLSHADFILFKRAFYQIVKKCTKDSTVLTKDTLLDAMHFPKSWNNIMRYKKSK